MEKPTIAITMGDPAGIGPELIVKVLSQASHFKSCQPLVIGDLEVMQNAAKLMGSTIRFHKISSVDATAFFWPEIALLCPIGLDVGKVQVGQVDPKMGKAVGACLKLAAELAVSGEIQGLVSAPLNKEAFHLAGFEYRDELAFLADLTKSSFTSVVGVMKSLWTITVTEHIPFKEVAEQITRENVLQVIQFFHRLLVYRGEPQPRIAVAALNPHAGDGGLMGREEIDAIRPAVDAAKAAGVNATGPLPADSIFPMALEGFFEGVVCMYHDQANIARKLQPKEDSATLFMGLPFACGTTAHGTAFDKAGLGISNPGSLDLALRCVIQLALGQQRPQKGA